MKPVNPTQATEIRSALHGVRHRLSPRQVRLLACACVRHGWHLLRSEASRRAVALAERFADGLIDEGRLGSAHGDARAAVGRVRNDAEAAAAAVAAPAADPWLHKRDRAEMLGSSLACLAQYRGGVYEGDPVALLRDLLIPPGASFEARWRSPDVMALARRAYEARDFASLPVLGDALEDAGCDSDVLLAHCREGGSHARGCWVLDLLGPVCLLAGEGTPAE